MARHRHIRIESGALRVDYRAGAEQIRMVAAELTRCSPEMVITVDDNVSDRLPSLPCATLWEADPQ